MDEFAGFSFNEHSSALDVDASSASTSTGNVVPSAPPTPDVGYSISNNGTPIQQHSKSMKSITSSEVKNTPTDNMKIASSLSSADGDSYTADS